MNVRRVVLALATLLLLVTSVPAFASARIVRLSYLAGDVRIDRNKAAGVEQAILNMPVVEGTRIYSVGDDARLEIEFENGSTVRMVGPGEINFRQLRLIDNGNKQTLVEVLRGIAYFDFKVQGDDDIRVLLRDRDLALRKSSHFRVQVGDPDTTFSVYKGELELQGQSSLVTVKKNETLSLDSNDHDRYYLSRSVSALDGDDFDHERDQYRNSYAQSNAYRYSGVDYGSPYSYGVNDLAYYGAYNYYPGYGYLWRPAGFAIGWDPFSYGAWSFYPGAGWVYVSAYPWGWTPYRYGNWINVPGYGWCWGPNGRVGGRGWYPVPVVRGPRFGGGHGPIPVPVVISRRPTIEGGRTIFISQDGRRPEPRDFALRPNPAQGPNGRPGHWDNDVHGGNGVRGGNDGRGGFDARGGRPAASTPVGPAANAVVTPSGGAITPRGGESTVVGGAVTPQGGAVRPVVPGLGREPDAIPRDRGERQLGHRVDNSGVPAVGSASTPVAPAASRPIGVATPTVPPVTSHEPMRRDNGPNMGGRDGGMQQPRNSAPVSAPAMRPSAPAVAPAVREQRSPQAFRGPSPSMRGGEGMRGPSMASSFRSSGGGSHGGGMSSGSHGGGGGSSSGSHGGGGGHR
jgi:FecR protein